MEDVVRDEFTFTSRDGATPIHCLFWLPPGDSASLPRAIVQIAHGMEEYVARYDGFACFLARNGFAVCGNDHIGHGGSVRSLEMLSHLPVEGASIMLADMHSLRLQFASRFPEETPYILFGHSMGSFALRCYLARYGNGLAGAIVCGTGDVPVAASRFGAWLARRMAFKNGADSYSPFINGLADGSYGKKIANPRTGFDWLNTDPAKVDEYIGDPLCGVPFAVGGYASLMDLTACACSVASARQVPAGLPMLFVSGEEDPVGGHDASGVKAAFRRYEKHSEACLSLKLYRGMRHEILNEPAREEVYADILAWAENILEG